MRPPEFTEFNLDFESEVSGIPLTFIQLDGFRAAFSSVETVRQATRLCTHYTQNITIDLYNALDKPFPGYNQEVFRLHSCTFDHCCTEQTCITQNGSTALLDNPRARSVWQGQFYVNNINFDTRLKMNSEECNRTSASQLILTMGYDDFIHELESIQAVRNNTYEVDVLDETFDDIIFMNSTSEGIESVLRAMGVDVEAAHRARRDIIQNNDTTIAATVKDGTFNISDPSPPSPPPPPPSSDDSTNDMLPVIIGVPVGLVCIGLIVYSLQKGRRRGRPYNVYDDSLDDYM